jgi:hypothetical protein
MALLINARNAESEIRLANNKLAPFSGQKAHDRK